MLRAPQAGWRFRGLNPNSEAGPVVAATPRRRKVPATPSSPVVRRRCRCLKKCDEGVAITLWRRGVAATFDRPLQSSAQRKLSRKAPLVLTSGAFVLSPVLLAQERKTGLQTGRRRAGEGLVLVQLKAQIVVTNAAGEITSRDGERHLVFARLQEGGVEGLGIFPPHAAIRVVAQRIGRDGPDGPVVWPLTPMPRLVLSAPPKAMRSVAVPLGA